MESGQSYESTANLEHSSEEWEALIQRAESVCEKIMDETPKDKTTNFGRTVGNLLVSATPDTLRLLIGDEEMFAEATNSLDYLERYMALIDRFPEFAQAEKNTETGMFPDIDGKDNTDPYVVVDEAEKALNGSNN